MKQTWYSIGYETELLLELQKNDETYYFLYITWYGGVMGNGDCLILMGICFQFSN